MKLGSQSSWILEIKQSETNIVCRSVAKDASASEEGNYFQCDDKRVSVAVLQKMRVQVKKVFLFNVMTSEYVSQCCERCECK